MFFDILRTLKLRILSECVEIIVNFQLNMIGNISSLFFHLTLFDLRLQSYTYSGSLVQWLSRLPYASALNAKSAGFKPHRNRIRNSASSGRLRELQRLTLYFPILRQIRHSSSTSISPLYWLHVDR